MATEDLSELYKTWRGRAPDTDAMKGDRGLEAGNPWKWRRHEDKGTANEGMGAIEYTE